MAGNHRDAGFHHRAETIRPPEETMIDEDGYPVYRQWDSKVQVVKDKFTYDNKPLKLWEQTWELLLKDILRKKRKLFKYPNLQLTDEHIKNYCLVEIETLLNKNERSLADFQELPWPNLALLTNIDNQESLPYSYQVARLHIADVGRDCGSQKKEDGDEATWIEIPEDFIINATESLIEQIMKETFPDFTTRKSDGAYLKEQAILTTRNDDADAINAYMFQKVPGPTMTYNSVDEVCKASTNVLDQQHLYPADFLNTLNFPGMPHHALNLKKELLIIFLRNVNPSQGLCNGTGLIITDLRQFVIWAQILSGSNVGETILIPRITLTSTQT
nr:ATP-dependent DNA helicase PIF1-like [Tanacetum cinerariifolium]